MEGMGQFIFLLVIIAFSVIDATSRNKKKRERMDEMEADEAKAEARAGRPGPRERREARREGNRPSEHRTVSTAPSPDSSEWERGEEVEAYGTEPGATHEASAPEEERVTADQLVPEELWAILTGQPVPERPRPKPRPAAPKAPPKPAEEEAAATRRTDTWMSGVEGRGTSDRWTSGSQRDPAAAVPGEASIYAEIEEPWGELEDITAGELGDGRGRAQGEEDGEEGKKWGKDRRAVRSARSERYLAPILSGKREGLRTAVIMQEVLGRPVAFRDEAS